MNVAPEVFLSRYPAHKKAALCREADAAERLGLEPVSERNDLAGF